jgi:hypothetical protein
MKSLACPENGRKHTHGKYQKDFCRRKCEVRNPEKRKADSRPSAFRRRRVVANPGRGAYFLLLVPKESIMLEK